MKMLTTDMVATVLATGDPARVDAAIAPKFKSGDTIKVVNLNKVEHNRMPAYIKGKTGSVTVDHGVFVFPDTSAHRNGPKPQHVYTVVFTARDLWGDAGHPRDRMYVDLWDDYMEHAN